MNSSLYISSGAMQAYQQKIDTAANNIANVNTAGYKRKDQSFSELLASQIDNQTKANQEIGRLTPNGVRAGYGVKTGLTRTDLQQGQAMQTDNPFDLMINGPGFFQIGYPSTSGGGTEIRYSRDGNFHLSPDANKPGSYHLVNASGGFLLDQNGSPIELDGNYEVNFDQSGQIHLRSKAGNGASFLSTQQVGIADIANPNLLKNLGSNEYAFEPSVLANGTSPANYVRVFAPGEVQITSGYLEGSNVDLSTEMTDLMATQRSFQMNARAVSYADQMLGIANNIMK